MENHKKQSGAVNTVSLILLAVDIIGMLVLAVGSIIAQSKCSDAFSDMGTRLPRITILFLLIPPWAYIVFFGIIIAALILKEVFIRKKSITLAINICAGVFGLLYLPAFATAMYMPLNAMLQSVSAAGCSDRLTPQAVHLPAYEEAVHAAGTEGHSCLCIDDDQRFKKLSAETTRLLSIKRYTPIADLRRQLKRKQVRLRLPLPGRRKLTPAQLYTKCKKSVLVIASVYTAKKTKTHRYWQCHVGSGVAITHDGVVVTAHHVIDAITKNRKTITIVAMTYDGKVYPVREVLAGSKKDDLAILKINMGGKRLSPAGIANAAPVGTPIAVIAHPQNRFYTLTNGIISRYYRVNSTEANGEEIKGAEVVAITADCSKGSSGGPVFDEQGNVAAIISNIISIYHKTSPKRTQFHMAVVQCTPAKRLLKLVK
ncbi:MAG: serine protease [Phycisphaerae bacterium]|nr:serine protease [Phycisphaerae bacterium]